MIDQVIRYPVRSVLLWVLGATMALFALLFGALTAWRLWDWLYVSGWDGLHTADVLLLIGLAGTCAFGAFAFGLAIRKPVGLRIDRHGISGYFAPTLKWTDIAGFEERVVNNGSGIFVSLKDPEGRAMQAPKTMRVLNVLDIFPKRSFINTSHLRVSPQEVIAQMEEMRLAAALAR